MRKVLNIGRRKKYIYTFIFFFLPLIPLIPVYHGMDSNFVGKVWPHLSNYEDVVSYNFLYFKKTNKKCFH